MHRLSSFWKSTLLIPLPVCLFFILATSSRLYSLAEPQSSASSSLSAPPVDSSTAGQPASGITEEQLKQMLVAKPLYLRDCYLDVNIAFNEHGKVTEHPQKGSYTLCGVEIEKVHLGKHKVELLGARYGLHFLGALPYEDPTKAVDRVRITPAKKFLRITIDREIVVKPKKVKEKKGKETGKKTPAPSAAIDHTSPGEKPTTNPESAASGNEEKSAENSKLSEAEQLKASVAAAPNAEKPADVKSVTTTTSPAHAAQVLRDALAQIFAPGLDEQMMATMPDFWKLYYQAAAAKSDYRPRDPAVFRQNAVDRKAKLISNFEPPSNEFAQAAGVAGMALYHVVLGADGKPGEIAVARPIGFGLDENAAEAIREARFEPALKDGKPVSVLVDLVVQFRIFSNRTALKESPQAADKGKVEPAAVGAAAQPVTPQTPVLPGPYSRQP